MNHFHLLEGKASLPKHTNSQYKIRQAMAVLVQLSSKQMHSKNEVPTSSCKGMVDKERNEPILLPPWTHLHSYLKRTFGLGFYYIRPFSPFPRRSKLGANEPFPLSKGKAHLPKTCDRPVYNPPSHGFSCTNK